MDNLPTVKTESANDIISVVTASSFLPRLQICSSKSDAVAMNLIPANMYGLVLSKEKIINLGSTADVLLIAFRAKALRMDKAAGTVYSYFDKNSNEFKNVQVDSETPDSGCMFGAEFLVWIPNYPTTPDGQGTFATLFLGSKTARREASDYLSQMGNEQDGYNPATVTLGTRIIKNAKFTWTGSTVVPCSKPFDTTPDKDEFVKQIETFKNPKSSVIEKADAETRVR